MPRASCFSLLLANNITKRNGLGTKLEVVYSKQETLIGSALMVHCEDIVGNFNFCSLQKLPKVLCRISPNLSSHSLLKH